MFGNYQNYPNFGGNYQNFYNPPMPDQLSQLRGVQNQPAPQNQQFPQFAPQVQQSSPSNGILWVNGEQEAQNYLVAPNCAVALWDSLSPTIYLKQADASGKPTIKTYDLVERSNAPRAIPNSDKQYVTIEAFNALEARLNAISVKIAGAEKNIEEDA